MLRQLRSTGQKKTPKSKRLSEKRQRKLLGICLGPEMGEDRKKMAHRAREIWYYQLINCLTAQLD